MLRIRINGESLIAMAICLLFFYLCIPFSMVLLNSLLIRLIAVIAAVSFILGMVLLNRVRQLVVFFVLFAFLVLYYFVTWRTMISSIFYPYYCFASLLFAFGGMALYSSTKRTLLRRVIVLITVGVIITAITSIIGLRANPLAAREMARGSTYDLSQDFSESKIIYRKMNIVSWSQAYGMLFAIPTAMIIWKKKKQVRYIGFMLLILLMLISSQITFALLLSIVLAFLTMITGENSPQRIILKMIACVLILILIIRINPVLSYAIELSDKAGFDYLTTKLTDMKILLLERRAIGDANERGELYMRSLRTFIESPIFGLAGDGRRGTVERIGYHSEFFDLLGSFGVVGFAVLCLAFAGFWRFSSQTEKSVRKDLRVIFIGFFGLFVFNPVFHSPQIFIGAFSYPLIVCRYLHLSSDKFESVHQYI